MPASLLKIGIPLALAFILWKKYGAQAPQLLSVDPTTGAAVSFDATQPDLVTRAYDWVVNLTPSQGILDFVRQTENLYLTPYHGAADAAGIYTIGYGHQILPSDPYWPYGSITAISESEAETLFENDAAIAADAVRRDVTVPLSQGQFDALFSWFFNLGETKIMTVNNGQPATLITELNAGDYAGASAEFSKWVYSNGQIQPGLVTRRASETATFNDSGVA
jgi:GH24 family phage-related lysozyme (muramidase)